MTLVPASSRSSGSGGLALLGSSVLGSSAASIDLQNLAATSNHLLLVCAFRTDRAAATDSVLLRFNNDSTANYDRESLSGVAGTAAAGAAAGTTSLFVGNFPAATATAAHFGFATIWVPNYASASMSKGLVANDGTIDIAGTTTSWEAGQTSGSWRSTAAITRMTFLPSIGTNLVAGSFAYIYGI